MDKKTKITIKESILVFMYFTLTAFWMECIYQGFTYGSFSWTILFPLLFSMSIAAILTLLVGFFPAKVNKVLMYIFTLLLFVFYGTQLVYQSLFQVPLLWGVAAGAAEDATAYWKEGLDQIVENLLPLFLMLLPIPTLIVLGKKILLFTRRSLGVQGGIAVASILLYFLPVLLIQVSGKESLIYTSYYEMNDQVVSANNLGIYTTFVRDICGVGSVGDDLSELKEVTNTAAPTKTPEATQGTEIGATATPTESTPPVATEPPVDTSPNVMQIDFKALAEAEKNKDVKTLDEYFASVTPTNKNEYTDMFKGKNLIFLTAEGFSTWAIDQNLTPTLYKLSHESFVFNNFYTSLWNTSTSDGEYVATLGLIPDGTHSFRRSSKNALPFNMAEQFNRLGVKSMAYHNGSLSYYDRNKTHPNMGYDFRAAKLGAISEAEGQEHIFTMNDANAWPASDYDMMVATLPEYVDQKPFHAYYMTISGHCHYNFEGQKQCIKNKDAVASLPYSEEAKAYIACNIELDKAMAYLLEELDKKGILEDTVIALSGDHYPYDLPKSAIDELAGHEVEENFELYKSTFILWSGSMKEPVMVDKTGSSLDILPTLSNLFGFTYDSRLMSGRDLLSDCEGVAILKNKSFVTDKVMYNSTNKKVTYLVDESQVGEDYVKNWSNEVKARFVAAAGILNYNYYDKIKDELHFE